MIRELWTETSGDVALVDGEPWPIDDAIQSVANGARCERLKALLQDVPWQDQCLFHLIAKQGREISDLDRLFAYGRLVIDFVRANRLVDSDFDEISDAELRASTKYQSIYRSRMLKQNNWQSPIEAAGLLK